MNRFNLLCKSTLMMLLLILAAAPVLRAQQDMPNQFKRAATQGIDNTRITLRLVRPDGEIVRATQVNGGLIRVEFEGHAYGLVPQLRDGKVQVSLNSIGLDRKEGMLIGETLEQLETLEVDYERPSFVQTINLPFGIQLERVIPSKEQTTNNDRAHHRIDPLDSGVGLVGGGDGNCCVTCGGLQTCACAVDASCGSCCTPPCCD